MYVCIYVRLFVGVRACMCVGVVGGCMSVCVCVCVRALPPPNLFVCVCVCVCEGEGDSSLSESLRVNQKYIVINGSIFFRIKARQ